MIKFVIAFVTIFQVLCAYGDNGCTVESDSLTFVKIGNIRYDTGKLYLTFIIYSYSAEPEQRIIQKEYELPQKDAANFLKLVNELDLMGIRSIKRKGLCNGCDFFGMDYIRGGVKYRIGIDQRDMNPDELERWKSYKERIDSILLIDHWQELFRAELPDGRYSAAGGVRKEYLKEDGQWFDNLPEHPLYIVDGVEVSHLKMKQLPPKDIERIEVLKVAAAAAVYGVRGSSGVVVITTKKKKKGLSRLLPWKK